MGYVGVYLCRKNLSTALPLIQSSFGVSKAQVGAIASFSTLAYGLGKMLLGPLVDRVGGRTGFFASLSLATLFCALGGFAPGLGVLIGLYSANRFCGAAAWGAMVKQVPDWFPPGIMARALSVLCLSYVVGGAVALWLSGRIAERTERSWQAVMGLPAAALAVILLVCWMILPRPSKKVVDPAAPREPGFRWRDVLPIFRNPQFAVLCALSFTTTLGRECFNTWTVDFLKSQFSLSLSGAANHATWFDIGGVGGILASGWVYDRATRPQLRWFTFAVLAALGAVLFGFAQLGSYGLVAVTVAVGLAGFLLYGPYSLLSGALAVDLQGKQRAATVACLVDAVGYLAGVAAGSGFGKLVDNVGYPRGFGFLGGLMVTSALLALTLFRRPSIMTAAENKNCQPD